MYNEMGWLMGFSEVLISRNIRRAANVKYGAWVIGIDEAEKYAEFANSSIDEVKAGKYKICESQLPLIKFF